MYFNLLCYLCRSYCADKYYVYLTGLKYASENETDLKDKMDFVQDDLPRFPPGGKLADYSQCFLLPLNCWLLCLQQMLSVCFHVVNLACRDVKKLVFCARFLPNLAT